MPISELNSLFDRFAGRISGLLPTGPTEIELGGFLLEQEERTRIYYAPFDYVNLDARVVVVGITPGRDSMMNGFRAATAALRQGQSNGETLRLAKLAGSFSNMRSRIAEMLDEIGMQTALGIDSCAELFAARNDLLHTTSCIRYPVFTWSAKRQSWVNYSGHSPKLFAWKTANRFANEELSQELRAIRDAMVVPCGKAVEDVIKPLVLQGTIDESRCLLGFPHASGANGHRKRLFAERKASLEYRIKVWARSSSSS